MTDYICPHLGLNKDSAKIQDAIDRAFESDVKCVLIEGGEWVLDKPVYLKEGVSVLIDGATLILDNKDENYIFKNSNILKPRIFAKYGVERYITIEGVNGAKLSGGGIYFYNAADFDISGLTFDTEGKSAITCVYSNHGRIHDISIENAKSGVEVLVGTRNCFLYNICGSAEESLIKFSSESREEMVYYNGPFNKNHIVRSINYGGDGIAVEILGKDTSDIIVNDVLCDDKEALGVSVSDANDITTTNIKSVNSKYENCKRLFTK